MKLSEGLVGSWAGSVCSTPLRSAPSRLRTTGLCIVLFVCFLFILKQVLPVINVVKKKE